MKKRPFKKPAVFFDRDGTILNELGYLADPDKMKFYADAITGLKMLVRRGVPLFVISNQSGIGRGYFSRRQYDAVNRAFLGTLKRKGITIQKVYICPHRPEQQCRCRKPKPFFLKQASRQFGLDLKRSFVIGDQARDVQLARAARAQGILVLTGKGKQFRSSLRRGDRSFARLSLAAKWIVAQWETGWKS